MTQDQLDLLHAAAAEALHKAFVELEAAILADDSKARQHAEHGVENAKGQLYIWKSATWRAKQAKQGGK